MNEELISIITEEIIRQLGIKDEGGEQRLEPLSAPRFDFADPDALERMKKRTTARIGVGRAGPRLTTQSLLKLRADHAQARDAVFADVSPALLDSLGLFSVQSRCDTKNTFITRPDLGRLLSDEAAETVKSRCKRGPDVQLIAADGLSSTAIEVNLPKILPVLTEALARKNITVGTPFFVKYGRVACEDHIAELTGARVVCILIGERPGLATAESMSAYIAYKPTVGMPESRRTVLANIHRGGTPAVEAGAHIVDLILMMLEKKKSGTELPV